MFYCVIPARIGSSRLPGKPLLDIAGKPMVEWVRQAALASAAARVVVATDHEGIHDRVAADGGVALMTAVDHASGTDRLAEVARLSPPGRIGATTGVVLSFGDAGSLVLPLLFSAALALADSYRIGFVIGGLPTLVVGLYSLRVVARGG